MYSSSSSGVDGGDGRYIDNGSGTSDNGIRCDEVTEVLYFWYFL